MDKLKTIAKFFGTLILIGLLLLIAALVIVEFNKPWIISKAESWYSENHSGELKINDFDLQIIRHFPNLSVQVDQLTVRDSSFSGRNHRKLSVGTVAISCSTRKLFSKKLAFKALRLKNIDLDILVDTLDQGSVVNASSSHAESTTDLQKWFHSKGVDLIVENANVKIINRPKKKRLTGTINELSGTFTPDKKTLSGPLHLDINMKEMGLNVEKGTFFNTAHLVGDLVPIIDLQKKRFYTAPFPLKIDEQDFLVSVYLDLGEDNNFKFELTNEATDYEASKGLISQDIQKQLEPYQLVKPFYTKTNIQGKFKGEGNALVTLDFNTKNNQCIINKTLSFDSLNFRGHLANRAIGDEFLNSKNKKDFHLLFSEVSGYYQAVPFSLKESFVQNTPTSKNLIQINLIAQGETERLNQIFKNDVFFFKSGNFDLTSFYKGNVKMPMDVLTNASTNLKINKTNVFYTKADLIIPVRRIRFNTKNGDAHLKSMLLEFPNEQHLEVTGNLENYTSLLFDELDNPIKSILKIESRNLDYTGLISTIQAATRQTKIEDITANKLVDEKNLRAAFENIYTQFNPELSINIDQFSYKNILLKDYKTFVNYQDKNTLQLSNSSFNFGEGTISMDGLVQLPEGNTTIATLGIKADGSMSSLNELFDNKDFMLEAGRFHLTADYKGSLDTPKNILTGSEVALQIKDTKIYHADQDLIIPIDTAFIILEKRDAKIVGLSIPLSLKNTISITGAVNNFTSLLQDELGYEVNSNVKISSSELSSKNFARIIEIFTHSVDDKEQTKTKDKNAIHRGVAMVYRKFHPSLEIQVDTFKSQDYLLDNLQAKVYYKNANTLAIEDTGFNLEKGRLDLSAIFDFSEKEKINSDLSLSANGEARRFDKLFNNNTFFFKEGIFDFKLDFTGNLLDKNSILENIDSRLTLDNGKVFYKDMNLTVPLDEVDLILRKKDAIINSFTIPLTSGHRIEMKGKVENFNALLMDSIPVDVVSDLSIYSKELDFQDLSRMFDVITKSDSLSNNEEKNKVEKTNVFKPTIQGIYDKFLPTVEVVIDDFWYKTFNAKNIKTGLQFKDRNHLNLQKTEFELGASSVLLDAQLDLSESERTGFTTDFTTENIDLDKLIKAFDFFGLPSLKSAGSVSGILSVGSNLSGHIIDKKGAIDTTLHGTVAFDMEDLRLKNFTPIMSTAGKILRDKRLKDIQFSQLIDTLKINNGTIRIPELNITSTAFTLYMKGDFRYDNKSNLLISVPWSNLWFWDIDEMPDRLDYQQAGKKFHIHALGNDENTMDYKFRFSGRKWYKTRGILHLYRRDKKLYRQERRKYKRARRKEKRNASVKD